MLKRSGRLEPQGTGTGPRAFCPARLPAVDVFDSRMGIQNGSVGENFYCRGKAVTGNRPAAESDVRCKDAPVADSALTDYLRIAVIRPRFEPLKFT
jgi:hypothetical protein